MQCKDATHLVSEVTIGSDLNIDVEYEHSTQENRTEVEGHLSGAIEFALAKLNASGEGHYDRQNIFQTKELHIQTNGSLKQIVSLTTVSTHLTVSIEYYVFALNLKS